MRITTLCLATSLLLTVGVTRVEAQGAPGGGYAPPPPPLLTPEEQAILARGEYTENELFGGGAIGTFLGFGMGHAFQGRWGDRGWIFTVGEIVSIGVMIYGVTRCAEEAVNEDRCNLSPILGGILAHTGFRIWEIADVWVVPARHNARVRELRLRLRYQQQPQQQWGFAVVPTPDGSAMAGAYLRF